MTEFEDKVIELLSIIANQDRKPFGPEWWKGDPTFGGLKVSTLSYDEIKQLAGQYLQVVPLGSSHAVLGVVEFARAIEKKLK